MANQPTKYRKFVVGAASAALVASAVAPVASAKDFSDTKGNTHEAAIDALSDAGVISGYPDGSFQPNKTLTRSDVVKLMGKWLESEGYEAASDYKTNPRFADLTSASNEELLKYAALVKDNGLFVGTPDGKLDPAGNITRENMAIVLVRAFDRVHDIDLATYVAGQDFKKDVNDRATAKAEARPAIDVLDFFDITNPAAPAFNPKTTTTRGHFATFLHKFTNADFSDVAAGVVGDATVKAVNATTVEVTFKDEVENINSLNFTIEGLTVSNAAVKQSDNKTVVLTTAVQEGGKEYTVALNSKEIGKFKGVSAVVPTKIDITTQSVQGKVGAQAIVSADVNVKQAGIPVTFNVKADTNTTLNKDQVFEAVTDENGIATFSYTQYAAGTDSVVAYPTGAPTVRSLGYVFWGVDTILNVEEVTTGETINNGANKTYKVTYKNAKTGKVEANKTFNVSVLENIGVTADKLQNVTVNGVAVAQLSNNTRTLAAQITTDSKGEATFTVSGTNAEATPVVFEAFNTTSNGVTNYDYAYEASDLQARASKVKFAAVQAEYTIDITRDGGEVAATGETNGREYKIVVKDKAGNLAKNETVNVAFNEDLDRVISTNTKAKFVNPDTDRYFTANNGRSISVKTNDKGEATFIIATDAANENDYATPIAWIDINNANAKQGSLDEGEPFKVAGITHFQLPYLDGAKLVAKKNGTGNNTSSFDAADKAVFSAELVNQSNKVFNGGYTIEKVTYTVFNEGAEDVEVNGVTISPNRSETFTTNGASLTVESADQKSTAVRVVATGTAKKDGKDFIFTAKEAKATFTNSAAIGTAHSGFLASYNTSDKTLKFVGKDKVKYAGVSGKTYEYYGVNGAPLIGADAFIGALEAAIATPGAGAVYATYKTDGDVVKFYLERTAAPSTSAPTVVKENVAPTPGTDGTLTLSAATVNYTQDIIVTVTDADLDTTANVDVANVSYTLASGSNAGTYSITLTETGATTGVFTATVPAALYQGATGITVTYTDAKTSTGGTAVKTASATITQQVGSLSAGTFTQAVTADLPAVYTSRVIAADHSFATGDSITVNTTPVNLAGKTGAQGAADAINAAVAGVTATVENNTVVITSNTVGSASAVAVSASNVSFFNNATVNGEDTAPATYAFTITNALAAGEKIEIAGEEYTLAATTAAGQAAELATLTNATFTITNPSGTGADVLLTAKTAGTITAPVVTVK